ncbi:MAG TPA: dicarboxylate/amino acid:cation symporter [Pirellulaceae bacterium]|nr:dicarboxylate/amino acid:cation symporter [Pirellulaceae bacterium]
MPADAPALPPQRPDGALARFFQWWHHTPLYLRILGGVILGVLVGLIVAWLKEQTPAAAEGASYLLLALETPSKLVLRLLGALAAPLILVAVIQALMHAQLPRGSAVKLVSLLLLNTVVAILIGLAVANVLQPGRWADEQPPAEKEDAGKPKNPLQLLLDNVPKTVLGPLAEEGKVISVIMLAVAFGIALRRLKDARVATVADAIDVAFRALITILHWIIEVIPLAVFGIVASIVGTEGFGKFWALGGFVIAVLIALALHTMYYMIRIRFGCWARPLYVLRGMRDALVMAFSTASSTATMPVTYACLREKVGLRERSASLGALVGANFNNDGTALYEAMAALFISQMLAKQYPDTFHVLTPMEQLMVVLMSIVASVGAAGIPEAGIVTMTLVFNAVKLPVEYIPLLLTVDWFLDRCRTMVNVLGDVNVSCMLDGHEREEEPPSPVDEELGELLDGSD